MPPRASKMLDRTCTDCGETKSVAEFHGKGAAKDGTPKYQSYCRPCANQRRYQREQQDPVQREQAKERSRKWAQKNRDLVAERMRQRRAEDPEKYRQREADRYLLKKYGLSREDWESLLEAQQGGCAICGEDFPDLSPRFRNQPVSGKICVDHDHVTGEIRGLLCDPCNKGIGLFQDDISILESAIQYLKE